MASMTLCTGLQIKSIESIEPYISKLDAFASPEASRSPPRFDAAARITRLENDATQLAASQRLRGARWSKGELICGHMQLLRGCSPSTAGGWVVARCSTPTPQPQPQGTISSHLKSAVSQADALSTRLESSSRSSLPHSLLTRSFGGAADCIASDPVTTVHCMCNVRNSLSAAWQLPSPAAYSASSRSTRSHLVFQVSRTNPNHGQF